MGGIGSKPVADDTPGVLNYILNEMLRRVDLTDLYSLSDPQKCSRYILFGQESIDKLFIQLRINPSRKPDGTIYFQSIDGLLRAPPPEVQDYRKKLCTELSFFFVRVFQVFAALYLSIHDSRLPTVDPVDDVSGTRMARRGAVFFQPSDFLGLAPQKPARPAGFFSGGALEQGSNFYITDENYRILNTILNVPESGRPELKVSGFSMYIPVDGLRATPPAPIVRYEFSWNGQPISLVAKLTIRARGSSHDISLSNFAQLGQAPSGKVAPRTEEVSQAFGSSLPVYSGAKPELRSRDIRYVLEDMFKEAARVIIGEPPFSVVKFFRQIGILGGSGYGYSYGYGSNSQQTIRGTNIILPAGQENLSDVKIVFSDTVAIGYEKRRTKVTVRANLKLDPPKYSATDSSYTYKVTVDFTRKYVTPEDAAAEIDFPNYREDRTFTAYSEGAAPTNKRGESIPEYLNRIFREVMQNIDEEGAGSGMQRYEFTRQGYPKPADSDQIPEGLRVRKLWDAIVRDPPVKSHCVARAAQLLSVAAIRGQLDAPAFSSVCRLRFAYQRDGSLPPAFKPVTDESGIYALTTLFYETLATGAPQVINTEEYKRYLVYLRYVFERYPSLEAAAAAGPVDGVKSITERPMPFCERVGDARVAVPRDLASDLRGIANSLLDRQRQHVGAAMNILFQLFDPGFLSKKRGFAFHPNIVSMGMPAIEKVAASARALLTEYYKSCETKYREGLYRMYQYDQRKPLQAVPT